jgi:hypothetical protein
LKASSTIIAPFYPFVSTRTLRSCHFEIGKFREAELRKTLPSPLYWIQPERKVLWNLTLLKDYLLNGDRPEHQRLVEQYLEALPSQQYLNQSGASLVNNQSVASHDNQRSSSVTKSLSRVAVGGRNETY